MKKILFMSLNVTSNRTPEENLGVYYLQKALSNKNIQNEYIDCWLEKKDHINLIQSINLSNYLFISITGCLSNVDEIKKIIPYVNGKCPVVCGGYGATFGYEDLLKAGVSLVMIGEGDISILQVVEYFCGKRTIEKVEGIAYFHKNKIVVNKVKTVIDLNNLPLLDNRKYIYNIIKNKAAVNILTSKGCNGNCIFCSINSFYKYLPIKWRGRDIEYIIEEIKYLYNLGVRVVKMVDDSFIENERDISWIKRFTTQLKKNAPHLLFRISLRADCVSEEMVKSLKDAGLFSVSCGIESGSDSVLKRIAKKSTVQQNQKALDIFQKYQIYVQAGFIMFDDETTMPELWDNLFFLKNNMQIVIKGIFTEMYAAEGTPYAEKLLKSNDMPKYYGNYQYKIKDNRVQEVYKYIKKWQIMLNEFYDKLIDPISAPKALSLYEYKLFYEIYLDIHKEDVDFFEKVLNCVEKNIEEKIIEDAMRDRKEKLSRDMKQIDNLYEKVGLNVITLNNIFIQ